MMNWIFIAGCLLIAVAVIKIIEVLVKKPELKLLSYDLVPDPGFNPTPKEKEPPGEIVTVEITKEQFNLKDRPMWYNKFVGETFEAYKKQVTVLLPEEVYCYVLTKKGLEKLNKLRNAQPGKGSISAIVYDDCAKEV